MTTRSLGGRSGSAFLDPDGTYRFSNNQVAHFGLATGQVLVGCHLRDVYPPGGAEFYQEQQRL